jgi:outer membrane protein OmpU
MKKILLATTMLAGTAGFASAEVAISGSGVFGIGYSENAVANPFRDIDGNGVVTAAELAASDETYAIRETYLTFTGTTTTDGGLELGVVTTFGTYDTDNGIEDDGSTIYASGAFGTLTMGAVSEADQVAALDDIGGLAGLGVDNVAEVLTGDDPETLLGGELSHNVHYKYSTGGLTFAASTLLGKIDDSYALGLKYDFANAYVGLGYIQHDVAATGRDPSAVSLYAGGTFGAVGVKAMYSQHDLDIPGAAKLDAWGLYADYTTGALTLMAEVADNDLASDTAYGIGASYDLGGGAAFVGGIASVNDTNRAEMGLSFSF